MNIHIPKFSKTGKGAAAFLAGIILFLYITNVLTAGLQTVILLSAIFLVVYGFIEMDGYNKIMQLIHKRK
jgi:hypothetical protein